MSDLASTTAGEPVRRREPVLPQLLGFAGLIPFWALALARITSLPHGVPPGDIETALATYAATIISFLGGIRWGIAARGAAIEGDRSLLGYVLSVIPQLVAWAMLALPDPARLFALGLLVLVLGPIDRRMARCGFAPPWFGRLRMRLSLGAGAALFLAGLA